MSHSIKAILLTSFLLQIIICPALAPVQINGKITNERIKYHSVKVRKENNRPLDIIISSDINELDQGLVTPVLLASTLPFPNHNKNEQWACGKLGGDQCRVPSEFIKNAKKLYLAVYCEKCEYTLGINYGTQKLTENDVLTQNEIRKDINLPQLRLLQTSQDIRLLQRTNETETLLKNKLRGASVSGIIYLIIFILCNVIGCIIMMNIYVNTKLVKTPLKLGKIETS